MAEGSAEVLQHTFSAVIMAECSKWLQLFESLPLEFKLGNCTWRHTTW